MPLPKVTEAIRKEVEERILNGAVEAIDFVEETMKTMKDEESPEGNVVLAGFLTKIYNAFWTKEEYQEWSTFALVYACAIFAMLLKAGSLPKVSEENARFIQGRFLENPDKFCWETFAKMGLTNYELILTLFNLSEPYYILEESELGRKVNIYGFHLFQMLERQQGENERYRSLN